MKKKSKLLILLIFIFSIFFISCFLYLNYLKSFRVAHAGGEYNGLI